MGSNYHIAHDELARLRSSAQRMQAASDNRLRPLGAASHSDGIVSCIFESQALDLARLNHFSTRRCSASARACGVSQASCMPTGSASA